MEEEEGKGTLENQSCEELKQLNLSFMSPFPSFERKKDTDVLWSTHSLLVGNRQVHKLEMDCILVWVLRKKFPSWFT